jgi:ribosomal protein S18 acetylase RimI-like enzyme
MRWSLGTLGPVEAQRVAEDWFLAYDQPLARAGFIWETEDGAGVAAWIPPASDDVVEAAGRAAAPITRPYTEPRSEAVSAMWTWIHDHLPDEPHWYLDHVAVDPEHQGRGLGVTLVEHGLALAEADQLRCFLVTGRQPLIHFYERRGFRVLDHGDPPNGGPHVWFMQT